MQRRHLGLAVLSFLFPVGGIFVACSSDEEPIRPVAETGAPDQAAALPPPDLSDVPCEPRRALETVCQQCHTRPLRGSAPFELVRRSDVTATRGRVQVRELMIEQLEARRMPIPPATISDDLRASLVDWLRAGAPATDDSTCAPADASADAGEDAPADAEADGDAHLDATSD